VDYDVHSAQIMVQARPAKSEMNRGGSCGTGFLGLTDIEFVAVFGDDGLFCSFVVTLQLGQAGQVSNQF